MTPLTEGGSTCFHLRSLRTSPNGSPAPVAFAQTGFETMANLLLMGILLDAVFQWIILGVSHPGAALVVGPGLIVGSYAFARTLESPLVRISRPWGW